MPPPFSIEFLDHVAIRVRNLERSAQWYEQVLGLQRLQPDAWKPWPIFMVAGQTGIALFPIRGAENRPVDHVAFRVSPGAFEAAKNHFDHLGIPYEYSDHHHFESIYFLDPDQHQLELTTPTRPMS